MRSLGGRPISLERSRVPESPQLRAVLEHGLVDGSITRTLRAAGLVPVRGDQWVEARRLTAEEARVLDRPPTDVLLASSHFTWDANDRLVERLESVLDPERFRLHVRLFEGYRR